MTVPENFIFGLVRITIGDYRWVTSKHTKYHIYLFTKYSKLNDNCHLKLVFHEYSFSLSQIINYSMSVSYTAFKSLSAVNSKGYY